MPQVKSNTFKKTLHHYQMSQKESPPKNVPKYWDNSVYIQ